MAIDNDRYNLNKPKPIPRPKEEVPKGWDMEEFYEKNNLIAEDKGVEVVFVDANKIVVRRGEFFLKWEFYSPIGKWERLANIPSLEELTP